MVRPISIFLACFLLAGTALGAVLRVPGDVATIQGAIAAAADGDTILVEPGTYHERLDFLGKAVEVRSTGGPGVTIIDASGGSGGGSVVTFASSEPPAALLEGFTLTGGAGTTVAQSTYGGGVYCTFAAPTIRGNVISGNTADFGGGVACFIRGDPVLQDNEIRDNVASAGEASPFGSGGGVFTTEGSYPTLQRNEIHSNRADYRGGGIASAVDSDPLLEGNVIRDNLAEIEGGGLAFWNTAGATLFGNTVSGNWSGIRGGGLFARGTAPLVAGNTFEGNVCDGNGGALSCYVGSDAWLESNLILGNTAGLGGGGVHCDSSSPVLLNNVLGGNMALCQGQANAGGGLLCVTESNAVVIHNTFYGNTSVRYGGGAMHVMVFSEPLVANSILWSNPGVNGAEVTTVLAGITITHSIVEGGWPGPGNLDEDPGFVDPEGGDLHLRLGSPAVDAGDPGVEPLPATDFEGDPRALAGWPGAPPVVDLGADELRPEMAARYGTVNAAGVGLGDVVWVNGSAGDRARREVVVPVWSHVSLSVTPPAAGPATAPFVLYAWEGEPDPTTLVPQPFGLGATGFATPLQPDLPQPTVIWNNLGHAPLLGSATMPSSPAPSVVIDKIVRIRTLVTVQGFIADDGSAAEGPGSVTNAVVVRVTD